MVGTPRRFGERYDFSRRVHNADCMSPRKYTRLEDERAATIPFSSGFNANARDHPANFHVREVQSGFRTRELFRMTFDLILVGLVALGLLVYLTAVLLRPERF
ncbi:hypothetical protein TMRO357_01884 [Alteriqipengyuania sp. 357]